MKVNVLRGQEHLEGFFREHIPKFWEHCGHHLQRMYHAFLPDDKQEVFLAPVLGAESPQQAKQIEKQGVLRYCQEKRPKALAIITEAWAWNLKGVPNLDHERMVSDPGYYAWAKSQGKKQEILAVQIETALGVKALSWEIVREDGKSPRLVEQPTVGDDNDSEAVKGEFTGFLLQMPE